MSLRGVKRRGNLPAGVLWISLASLFTDIAGEAVYPILPLYLTSLGASPAILGLVEGVAETTASLLKLFSGWWSDRLGRSKPLVLVGYSTAVLAKGALTLATTWPQVLLLRFADRFGKGVRGAPRDAWLSRISTNEELPRVYGFHRAMDNTGAVLGPLCSAAFLALYPGNYRSLFLWTLIPGFIAVICLLVPKEKSFKKASRTEITPTSPGLRRFVLVLGLFTLANSADAFLILRLKEAGWATALIPLTWAALHVVKVAGNLISHRLVEKWNPKQLLAAGWIYYAGIYLAVGWLQHPLALALAVVGYGIFFGMTEGPERTLVARLSPSRSRGKGFGVYALSTALPALPASVLFGLLWQRYGSAYAFTIEAALAATAGLILFLLPLPAVSERKD